MNEKFFNIHGLHAMIMCYKPSDSFQPSDTITHSVSARNDGHGGKLSPQSGTTRNELELEEAAPLVFPGLDSVSDENRPNAIKRAGNFLGEYYDRRAQARFVSPVTITKGKATDSLRNTTTQIRSSTSMYNGRSLCPGTVIQILQPSEVG